MQLQTMAKPIWSNPLVPNASIRTTLLRFYCILSFTCLTVHFNYIYCTVNDDAQKQEQENTISSQFIVKTAACSYQKKSVDDECVCSE